MARSWDNVRPSAQSMVTHPMLAFVVQLNMLSNNNKTQLEANGKGNLISLAVGDPTLDGNNPPPPEFMAALEKNVSNVKNNGYTPSIGSPTACAAVANYWVKWFAPSQAGKLSADHVVLASGCSDALSMVFGALANSGEHILFPEPYFAQYDLNAAYYGIEPLYYPCDKERNWEVNIPALRAIIEKDRTAHGGVSKIKGILINNPSNPCGSNFSRTHVTELVHLMDELRIPIIADEIYAGMVFDIANPDAVAEFTSVADVDSLATRFIVGGASKRFCIPGERIGWILQVDPTNAGAEVMKGVRSLAMRYLVPMTAVQTSIAECLDITGEDYFQNAKSVFSENAAYLYTQLSKIPVLKPIVPAGGMFMSVLLDTSKLDSEVNSGLEFACKLAVEENVHVYPGEPFHMDSAFRLSLSRTPEITHEAVRRLEEFCARHMAS